MTNGNEVEQQTFDGANTQKWIFTHIGSNVYTIRSTKNNSYYLGVQNDSTADDTPIVLRTGTVTNGMKWRVENGNQGYKIVSYSDPTMVLCTGTASATAGSNLKLSDFQSGNNSYQDEWELHDVTNYAYITNSARIYFDSGNAFMATAFLQVYQMAASGFLTQFHIEFNLIGITHSTVLDLSSECSASNQNGCCSSVCAPLANCNSLHHRSAYRMLELLKSNSHYTYRLVGYGICYYDGSGHDEDLIGLGDVNGKNALTSLTRTSNLKVSIQHELTHNLGGSHNTCVAGQRCILKGDLDEWCDACAAAIRDNYS